MCKQYITIEENKKFINNTITYYKKIKKSKFLNLHLIKYFKILAGRNQVKKMIKEIIIFHFPILGYVRFILNS